MAPLTIRDSTENHRGLSTSALIALLTSVGIIILGSLIGLSWLLVRAVRTHKQLLADLEQRGVNITPPRMTESSQITVTRPRAVLRRNSFLPFNSKNGWGSLPSHETIPNPDLPPPSPPLPPHATVPRSIYQDRQSNRLSWPAWPDRHSSRLSWPFPGSRKSGRALQLKRIRVKPLSAIVESPKASPLVPILGLPQQGLTFASGASRSRPNSDQSLLKHHPALRGNWESGSGQSSHPQEDKDSQSPDQNTHPEKPLPPNRSKSLAAIPTKTPSNEETNVERPRMRTRSRSLGSQSPGLAPDAPMPPPPPEVARIKMQERRRSLLAHSPSRFSVSSFESVGSSILATQSSPMMKSTNPHLQKVAKRHPVMVGPRPHRDPLTLHGRNQPPSQSSIKTNVAHYSVTTTPSSKRHSTGGSMTSSLNSANLWAMANTKASDSARWTRTSYASPTSSTLTPRSITTPRRHSGITVTTFGSPQERRKPSVLRNVSGNQGPPMRQLSQASTRASSTRSSNGNPFQWDPAPLQSGKPSALKGSPSARKGHRRQNCVRISLAPTILGPPSRSPSPCLSMMKGIQEESPDTVQNASSHSIGAGFSSMRTLSRPPSSPVFAPELKLNPTSARSSLTPSSPALSLAAYRMGDAGLSQPCQNTDPWKRARGSGRLSTSPIFNVPTFSSRSNNIDSIRSIAEPPPTFRFSRPSNEYVQEIGAPDSSIAASSPFDSIVPDSATSSPTHVEEYDPKAPRLGFLTANRSSPTHASSLFTTTTGNHHPSACRSRKHAKSPSYSPPCSPKTIRPHAFLPTSKTQLQPLSTSPRSRMPNHETSVETIDPALLRNDVFTASNSNIIGSMLNSSTSALIPSTSTHSWNATTASCFLDPLLKATFPSQSRTWSTPLKASASAAHTSAHSRSQSAYQSSSLRHQPPHSFNLKTNLQFDRPSTATNNSPDDSPTSVYSPQSPTSTYSTLAPTTPSSPRPAHATVPLFSKRLSQTTTPSLQPMGPRASPAKELRRSVAELRRMNSEADRGSRGERRYLRLGREASLADLSGVGDDSLWEESVVEPPLDTLDNWEDALDTQAGATESADGNKGSIESDPHELNGGADKGIATPEPDINFDASIPTQSLCDSDAPDNRSSSVWADGEKFWQSTPPRPESQITSPMLSPSPSPSLSPVVRPAPLRVNMPNHTSANVDSSQKRASRKSFLVKPDEVGTNANSEGAYGRKRAFRNSGGEGSRGGALAGGKRTPNAPHARVSIQIHPPSDRGTPGSLYDADGFLRG